MVRFNRSVFLVFIFIGWTLAACDGGCSKQKSNRNGADTGDPSPANIDPAAQTQKIAIESTQTAASAKDLYGLDQSLPVAGLVTGDVNGVDSKTAGTIAIDVQLQAMESLSTENTFQSLGLNDSCASGTYTAKLVGSGYELIKDVTYTGGTFKIGEAPKKHEVMVELSCGLRCIVQAGQKGVLCNRVADSILSAFEIALGRSVYDPIFSGVKLAKVASSIVDAALIRGDETDAFKTLITNCAAQYDGAEEAKCYSDAIKNSPFYPSFKIMQQLSEGWSAEGLYSFVTTVLGASVEIDSELYGWIMDSIEKAMGTNFVSETRKILADAVKAQNANEPRYPFQVVCNLEVGMSPKKFKPDLSGDNKLICNRDQAVALLTSAGIAATYHDAIINGTQRDSVECTEEGAPTDPSGKKTCWARLSMRVESLAQEVNRNDSTGTKRTAPTRSISMVDVMPQVMIEIQKAKIPIGDGPFPDLNEEQKKKLQEIINDKKDFFLGLIGIYRMLNDPELRSIKLSLLDLHEIFTDKRFLNTRLVGWGPGLSGVQVVTANSKNSRYLDPLLKPVTGQNKVMTMDDRFRFNPSQGFQQRQMDLATATTLVQQSSLEFQQTFDMFSRIPTSREVERFILDASRHEEWNPVGSRYLHVAQLKNTGKPIFCRLVDPGPNFSFSQSTKVECDNTADGVTCGTGGLEEGQCTTPANYSYPFILMERGWFGEDKGRLFMLASRSNGRPIGGGGPGNEGTMVREVKSGNAAGECDSSQSGKVAQYISRFQCGDNAYCQQNVTAYCMDLGSFGRSARKRFYPGGVHKVTSVNYQTGETNTWDVPRIGVNTPGTDHSKNTSACLHVPSGTFTNTSGSNSNLAVYKVDALGDLSLGGVSNAAIKDCAESASTGNEKYILFNWRDFSDTETPYAYLMTTRNETLMWTQTPVTDNQWERNYARLSQAQIEALLGGKKIMGTAQTNIDGVKYVNPAHDPKFDPYCDDTNGNGVCDCFALENMSSDGVTVQFSTQLRSDPSQCGLRDKAAEPTIAQLPYCSTCTGGDKAAQFFETYGGKSEAALASAAGFFGSSFPPFDVNSAAFCLYKFSGESKFRSPRWINFQDLGGKQEGCPETPGVPLALNNKGPIRIINPKPMNNAFLIDRPRQILQLMNYSFKSLGQGVSISRDEDLFTTDEAYALIQLRLLMPPDQIKVVDSQNNALKDVTLMFRSVEINDGDHSDPLSGALKGILLKAGRITDQDLEVKRPDKGP